MKCVWPIFSLALLVCFRASAQVNVEMTLEQDQFLPSESLPVAVHITNRSGQSLHLGADTNWLTFDVESADSFIVLKKADVPVQGEFELGSSEVATKRVDLAPYFVLTQSGRYHIIATVRIKAAGATAKNSPHRNLPVSVADREHSGYLGQNRPTDHRSGRSEGTSDWAPVARL